MLISDTTISLDDVTPNNTYRNVHFTYSSRAINIQDVTFERVTFDQDDFSDSTWSDVIFDHVDLSNTILPTQFSIALALINTRQLGLTFLVCKVSGAIHKSTTHWLISSTSAGRPSKTSCSITHVFVIVSSTAFALKNHFVLSKVTLITVILLVVSWQTLMYQMQILKPYYLIQP